MITKIFRLLVFFSILNACTINDNTNDNGNLIGQWKLIEVLLDPGDGSGTFTEVESNKIISFSEDGIISSNGSLCDTSINTNNPTIGTYSAENSTFNSNDCIDPNYNYSFEQVGPIIIINYPCIEPCQAKYMKQ